MDVHTDHLRERGAGPLGRDCKVWDSCDHPVCNNACFVGRNGRKGKKGKLALLSKRAWKPTAFEDELLDRGIKLINSRPCHPQTNGKVERFFRSLEEEIRHYESVSEYIKYYNDERLHWSLDIDNYQSNRLG